MSLGLVLCFLSEFCSLITFQVGKRGDVMVQVGWATAINFFKYCNNQMLRLAATCVPK